MFGHNVSNANNKTAKVFQPNLHMKRIYSDTLAGYVRLKVSSNGMRTIVKHGGLDEFLSSTLNRKLTPECKKLKREIAYRKSLQA